MNFGIEKEYTTFKITWVSSARFTVMSMITGRTTKKKKKLKFVFKNSKKKIKIKLKLKLKAKE